MKIKSKILIEFLKKINMTGSEQINEAIFDFNDTGLKISAISPTKVNRVDALLKPNAFTEYEAINKIGIQDISTLIKILSKFKDEISIIVEGNTITIKDNNKSMTTTLMDTQFIQEIHEMKELVFDDYLTIDSANIKEVIDDASINKEYDITFETVSKGLKIFTSGKYKFNRNFVVEEAKGGVKVSFGTPLVNAITNLTDKIQLYLKKDFPVKILETTENSIISLIVSPLIKN